MAQPQTTPATWTIEMLEALPDDGWRYELVEGRLVRMPPPGFDHGDIGENMAYALSSHVRAQGLGKVVVGEAGWELTRPGEKDDTVQASDLAFVRADRLPPPHRARARPTGHWRPTSSSRWPRRASSAARI